jgi:hypothetical protein
VLPQPIVITTSKAFTALKILGCSVALSVPSRPWHDGDGDDQYPLPAGSRRRGVRGGGGAKRRDQVVVLVFGKAGLGIASLSTKKGPRSCGNCSDWH